MSRYGRGAKAEHECIEDLLANHGFVYALRSAGSHGVADIVAFRYRSGRLSFEQPTEAHLVAVRSGKRPGHSPAERAELLEQANRIGAEAWEWLCKRNGNGRKPTITFRRITE